MREKISLVKHDKLGPGQASFGHLTGYDAGYYGQGDSFSVKKVYLRLIKIYILPRLCGGHVW
jgi:hypothetical protein